MNIFHLDRDEVMVVKKDKVIVIDKKYAKEYLNKGWDLTEATEEKLYHQQLQHLWCYR